MRKLLSGLVLSLTLITSANAADYTVQVGAYRTITQQAIDKAQRHGQTFQRRGSDNLERLSVGRFSNRADAKNMRDKLQAAGYSGAFVSRIEDSSSAGTQFNSHSSKQSATSNTSYTSSNVTQKTRKSSSSSYTIDDLSRDERQKATYLDDQLRILSNGRFYTVEQYRQQSRRQQNGY